jgi:putative acetyltransferase
MKFIKTDSDNQDFRVLVAQLDSYLQMRDGDMHAFFSQYNKIDHIKYVLVAYHENTPIACGALKQYDHNTMEIKRMFVVADWRKKGVASKVLAELEAWSKALNFERCILETGENLPEAIQLYHKNNYKLIPNYGQYVDVAISHCFEKIL